MPEALRAQEKSDIFALDIGTRSIIGVVGRVENGKFHVLAIDKENHDQRAMMDGQIEDIGRVAALAENVVRRLERSTRIHFTHVCIAAAGRALKSESASFTLEMAHVQQVTDDLISQLEAGAVSEAEKAIAAPTSQQQSDLYYMVGYTVAAYRLDGYPMSSLREHSGKKLEADVVATFLPREVVESLYAVMTRLNLEVASMTLEPIASLNAAIPNDIRLLNLVLVDIGAGTSDIAICRDGSVVGYTMATIAGDEVTELLMRALLVDFDTGETLKMSLGQDGPIHYADILGLEHDTTSSALQELIAPSATALAKELTKRILELNGRTPSAVFLAGGGSKLVGLREKVAAELKIEPSRVAVAGNHFRRNAFSEEYNLNDPEYATPLGIAISAGLGLISDSYVILLNGQPAKLFRSGVLVLRDILLMNGYHYGDLIGRTGANLTVTVNGERKFFRGQLATPPVILLNDDPVTLSAVVHAGDSIRFVPARAGADAVKTVGDLVGGDFYGTITVNGAVARLSDVVHTGDEIWADPLPRPTAPEPLPTDPPIPKETESPSAAAAPLHITMNGNPMELSGKPNGDPYYLMDLLEYAGLDFDNLKKPVELTINGAPGQFTQKVLPGDNVYII